MSKPMGTTEKEMKEKRWNKEFDKEYGKEIDTQLLGIVAESMLHAQIEPFGADASYITTRLRKIVDKARKQERQRTLEEVKKFVVDESGISGRKEIIQFLDNLLTTK